MSSDASIADTSIRRFRDRSLVKHQPFRLDELPRKGTLVAIDAEFVSLQQEEAEFHSDGTKKVLRPSRMTLARVSVLRGEGPETGIPFIDDHIHTSEPIVDYLTEFSGIRGALSSLRAAGNPLTSAPLCSWRPRPGALAAYARPAQGGVQEASHARRPRLCLHWARTQQGLPNYQCVLACPSSAQRRSLSPVTDIYIPPSQIIDTVNIYHLPHRQRKLSLRFLAYAVLHSNIQADTHDSIEDARTALQLYEHYQRLEAEGTWEEALEEVYREGKQTVRPALNAVLRTKLTLRLRRTSKRRSSRLPRSLAPTLPASALSARSLLPPSSRNRCSSEASSLRRCRCPRGGREGSWVSLFGPFVVELLDVRRCVVSSLAIHLHATPQCPPARRAG